jgi:hypothetical protein
MSRPRGKRIINKTLARLRRVLEMILKNSAAPCSRGTPYFNVNPFSSFDVLFTDNNILFNKKLYTWYIVFVILHFCFFVPLFLLLLFFLGFSASRWSAAGGQMEGLPL